MSILLSLFTLYETAVPLPHKFLASKDSVLNFITTNNISICPGITCSFICWDAKYQFVQSVL